MVFSGFSIRNTFLAALVLLSPQWLGAQTPFTNNPLYIVRQMPIELQKEWKGGKADDNYMMSHNQPHYLGAEYQRGGMDTLLAGLALRKKDWIEEGFQVANATFMKQAAGGGFGDKVPTGGAFWVNACARTFLALKQ